jgi:epoxyqueuosine reductase
MMNITKTALNIRRAALVNGYENCGIIKIAEMKGYAEAIAKRIARYPESKPMYGRLASYAEPNEEYPWAKSVVVCVRWYGKYYIPKHLDGLIGKSFLLDTRRDTSSIEYKKSIRFEAALQGLGLRVEAKKDFGITALRWAAMQAGIGAIRKNNFFYTTQGSWCTLEAYFIDHELELKQTAVMKKCPHKCNLCIKSCPTGALGEPFQMNGMACISYLMGIATCEPDKKHYDKSGSWIFGCDACQNACPFNRIAWSATEKYPGLEELSQHISYEQILTMDYAVMRELLPKKFWYIKEDVVWKWKCNVLNAMCNTYHERYAPYIEKARHDEYGEVRAMAEWVCARR